MTTSIFARIACAIFALTATAASFDGVTSVNPINFEGQGSNRPALYV